MSGKTPFFSPLRNAKELKELIDWKGIEIQCFILAIVHHSSVRSFHFEMALLKNKHNWPFKYLSQYDSKGWYQTSHNATSPSPFYGFNFVFFGDLGPYIEVPRHYWLGAWGNVLWSWRSTQGFFFKACSWSLWVFSGPTFLCLSVWGKKIAWIGGQRTRPWRGPPTRDGNQILTSCVIQLGHCGAPKFLFFRGVYGLSAWRLEPYSGYLKFLCYPNLTLAFNFFLLVL